MGIFENRGYPKSKSDYFTWWLIPLSKWVITPVINGISRVYPLVTGVVTHLLSGMSHQVVLKQMVLGTPHFRKPP